MDSEHSKREVHAQRLWVAAGILVTVSVVTMLAAYFLLLKNNAAGEADYSSYQYHIAIISDEMDNSFWEEVCDGAVAEGAKYGAYVEQIDEGLVDRFSMEDAMNVAIYEGVDGILLRPTEDGMSAEVIDKAYRYGIPVITMQKDVTGSKRQGFVGINDYFLGQEYGKRVLKLAKEDTRLVTVLFPGASFNETSQNWFRQGLINTVQQEQIRFEFRIIWDDRGLNNAEGVIHDIAEGKVEQPDMIICLDEVLTQSACQLIRDQGLSERIKVIGSYASDYILKEIEEGYIDSTITIDPAAMGRMSVDALMTYKKYHMVSYYTEVDTMLIDQSMAAWYRREEADGEDPDEKK